MFGSPSTSSRWPVATSERPCPRCGHKNRCKVAPDGKAGVCWREDTEGKPWNDAKGKRPAASSASKPQPDPPKLTTIELELLDRQCRSALTPDRLARLAERLTVSTRSLRSLGIGWHTPTLSYTFPMRDAHGRIIGMRTRKPDGSKACITGSRLGIITPDAAAFVLAGEWLLVCEGESDAAAALDLGFNALGRPGCGQCRSIILAHVANVKPERVGIIADNDEPGQKGAHALARSLADAGHRVRVVTLPAKDLRDWKATTDDAHHDLLARLETTPDRKSE